MADVRVKAYGAAAAIFALDRVSKWFIDTHVSFYDRYRVIPGFFEIVRSQNRGIAFGIFDNLTSEWRTILLIAASLIAVIAMAAILWNAQRHDRFALWGLSLILGGASGNVFDRIASGQVTDFLLFYIRDYQWPTFNIADSAIVIGCGLLLLDQFRQKKQQAAHVS
jgi:signal peptidase II